LLLTGFLALGDVVVNFSRPLQGLIDGVTLDPTDESVGYCHLSASRTGGKSL